MAIDGINISLDQVRSTASSISSINTDLYNKLQDVKKQMDNLAQTWQSDGSNTIRERFNALQPKFEQYKSVVDSYVTFLNQTSDSYDQTESSINSNASAFNS